MGFRFRQVLRVLPGLRLNLSKSGVSTSLGGHGATVNLSKKGIRGTVGLPGSGLSYSKMLLRSAGGVPSPASRMTKPESLPEQAECDPATSQTGEKTSQEVLDELYLLTAHLVVKNENASISWLQRQLRIGYIDAAELMEKMEADGIVSPPDRIGRRKVLVGIHDLPELPE